MKSQNFKNAFVSRNQIDKALVGVLVLGNTCAIGVSTAFAQSPVAPPPVTSPATSPATSGAAEDPGPYVSDKDYRLAPDDALDITVVNHPEASVSVVVMPNGTVKYPRIGQLKVAGMTSSQLETRITTALNGGGDRKKAYYINPQVLIYVRARQQRTVNVLGTGVRTTGKTPLKEGWRLFDLVASIGGVSSDRLDFYDARLIRNATMRKIDMAAIYRNDAGENILLRPDDTIVIDVLEESKTTLQVIGEVAKPGAIVVPRDGSLATVLGQAGPSPRAHLSSAKIERAGEIIPVDLSRWFKDGQIDSDVKVQAGDRLIIPENKRLYSIYGPVGKSGTQIYPDDRRLTVLSALADAGGSTEGLELQSVQVVRPAKQDGVPPAVFKVDVKDMLKKGELTNDIAIQPGDIIYVPAAKRRRGLGFQEILGFIGAIPIISFLFRR